MAARKGSHVDTSTHASASHADAALLLSLKGSQAPASSSSKNNASFSVAATIIRASSSRRRARAFGNSHSEYAAEEAYRRRHSHSRSPSPPTHVKFEFELNPPDEPEHPLERAARIRTRSKRVPRKSAKGSITLPRVLNRPAYCAVPASRFKPIDPKLAEIPVEYVQDSLAELGPGMLNILASVEFESICDTGEGIPEEVSLSVSDDSSDAPTHVFAIHDRQPDRLRKHIVLYPAHHLVWAANCAKLPEFAPSHPGRPAPGEPYTVPVVPLCIPHSATFADLAAYIYSKRADNLLSALLPDNAFARLADPRRNAHLVYAESLAMKYSAKELLTRYVTRVQGLWRNVCALGLYDQGIWFIIDLVWEVLLNAVAISTGSKVLPGRDVDF
ncbi:uncharacterized protein LAESUDRAFT_649919 [Laetiporus sulphureus 93-53]|uniref:Uncharacterized protein n=1 Tax=Laetiporus sulphureus 93-53 TaxID=1314785 RepID=A0A165F0G6_9APHY|nr:uncharacterized protein LAESUDRAFT_649919 [Laetiporus sulphureus 93-53]KZT08104.1 hypothetical protein LAESUDRAFT_649919 [Laetiporus sulphureus 93-53]